MQGFLVVQYFMAELWPICRTAANISNKGEAEYRRRKCVLKQEPRSKSEMPIAIVNIAFRVLVIKREAEYKCSLQTSYV